MEIIIDCAVLAVIFISAFIVKDLFDSYEKNIPKSKNKDFDFDKFNKENFGT